MRLISRLRLVGLSLVVILGIGGLAAQPSPAQFSWPEVGQPTHFNVPSEVTRYGSLEVTSVKSPLDKQSLFTLASPTVYDRSDPNVQLVERRAAEVEARLRLAIFSRRMDMETMTVEVSRLNNVTIIDVRDNQDYPRPLVLVSVTEQDADYNGKAIDALAQEWQGILDEEIRQGQSQLSADALAQSVLAVGRMLGLLIVMTGLIWGLKFVISRHKRGLRHRLKELAASAPSTAGIAKASAKASTENTAPLSGPSVAQKKRTLERQLGGWKAVQWLLFWGLVLTWYIGLIRIFGQIPGLAAYQGYLLSRPLDLLVIWFLTGLAIRLSRWLVDYATHLWQDRAISTVFSLGDDHRRQLRTSTIAGSAKGLATVLIALFGLLAALGTLGLPTASVVAIGSLVGLAITFGSQNLVKDLVNGFFILAEDQYAIGDVIEVGDTKGLVENLNLRVTQLRTGHGELVTLPNNAITQVKNLTRNWSRVNFSINVAYHADPDKALSVLQEVAHTLYQDPHWHEVILAEPTVLGIDDLSHDGMTITTWIQTEPNQQWSVGREFRLRVRRALEKNGIQIGIPQYYSLEASLKGTPHAQPPEGPR